MKKEGPADRRYQFISFIIHSFHRIRRLLCSPSNNQHRTKSSHRLLNQKGMEFRPGFSRISQIYLCQGRVGGGG